MKVERPSWRLLSIFHLLCLHLLGLTVYVRTLPSTPDPIPLPNSAEAAWWGVWPITYLPATIYWPAFVLILITVIAAFVAVRRDSLTQTDGDHSPSSISSPTTYNLWLTGCAVALFISFYLFPIAHTRWGDAYLLSRSIAWPELDLRLTHSWQAPLDVRVHSIVWHLLGPQRAWSDAVPVYRLLSPIAGAGYLATALALARRSAWAPSWLSFGLLASLGLLQLFYGYIENYSFAAAGILLYLYLGLEALQGRRPLWWAALALAITNALHPSTIVLAPSLLICAWFWADRRRNKFLRALVIDVAVPVVLVAAATIVMMEAGSHGVAALLTNDRPGGSDARWFVPVFATTTRWEHYTLFSGQHLRDMMNLQLLVAPSVLPVLGIIGLYGFYKHQALLGRVDASQPAGKNRTSKSATHDGASTKPQQELVAPAQPSRPQIAESTWFLLLAAGAYLSFVWTWNPDYGGQRDWDLFSLAAVPATLLAIDLLPRIIPAQSRLVLAIGPLLLFQVLHTAAWIYQNTLPWEWP